VDKKRARLNCIHHLLKQVPYHEVDREMTVLPERVYHQDYNRQPVSPEMFVPEVF
jgi:polyphosphate kinase